MFMGVDGRILWAVQLMFYALVGAAIFNVWKRCK